MIGDFVVSVGSILHNEEFKGVMVEAEYRPVKSILAAKNILVEFAKILKQNTAGLHHGRCLNNHWEYFHCTESAAEV